MPEEWLTKLFTKTAINRYISFLESNEERDEEMNYKIHLLKKESIRLSINIERKE